MEKLYLAGSSTWIINSSLGNGSLRLENLSAGRNSTADPLKRNEDMAKVEVTVLCLILFLALTGNLCVLLAIHTTRHKHSRMYFFMKHLSIADLVVAIFQVLPQLIWDITFRFYGPDFLCRLIKYLQVVGMFASTYMLLLMSLDRCLAICQPLRSLHRRADRVSVLLTWLLCLLVSIPQIHIFSLRDVGNGVYDCWADFIQPWGPKAYVTWITLMVYIIPVLMLSICYGLISFKIWQNVKLKTAHGPSVGLGSGSRGGMVFARVSSTRLISKAKIRTVKMTFIIVLAFIVCWTPFFFVQMWSVWDTNAPQEASPFIIAMLLASLNSCCNPWIYMLYTGHLFHDLMRRLLCCSARCLKSRPACELSKKSNSSSFVLSCRGTSQRSFMQPSTT
ncbi:oxytocin receptor [Anomalospiza imberbis]|nr:oxytocin receptor [Vidua macroura]